MPREKDIIDTGMTRERPVSMHPWIILCLILLLPVLSTAQPAAIKRGLDPNKSLNQYTLESWLPEDGLPQSSVNSLAQTPDGYLWLGTQEGIVRFDGVRFTTFDKRNTPEMTVNYVQTMIGDRKGRLWIALAGSGLVMKDGTRWKSITRKQGLMENDIRVLHEAADGSIWVGYRERGISVLRGDTVAASYDARDGIPDGEIRAIGSDHYGRIIVGTLFGIVVYRNGRFEKDPTMESLVYRRLNCVTSDHDHSIWYGTSNGLFRQLGSTIQRFTTSDGLPSNTVYAVYVDRSGVLWIGTDLGYSRLAKGVLTSYSNRERSDNIYIVAFLQDTEGNLWIGSDGGGLNVLKDGLFTTFTRKEGLLNDMAWTVFEDAKKNLWVGTEMGLTRLRARGDHWDVTNYTTADGLSRNVIWAIGEDGKGNLLVGSSGGLNLFNGKRFSSVELLPSTTPITVQAIFRDGQKNVWIGTTTRGAIAFMPEGKRTYTPLNGVPDENVICIAEDTSGTIWLGTEGHGVLAIRDTVVAHYTMDQGLMNNSVNALYADRTGAVWVGTLGGGLSRIKNNQVASITTKNGLFDDLIFALVEDRRDRLWMTCNKGIFSVSKDDLNACADGQRDEVVSVVYGREDGLKAAECNGGTQPAAWRSSDGRLWFVTVKGVAMIDPDEIRVNQQPPAVVIEEFIDNGVSRPIQDAMTVEPGKRRIDIRFTGISFLAPQKVRFKYRLEGYEQEWVDAGLQRDAQYTNISPGQYRFHVIAANSDGIWNTEGASVPIIFEAFFYQTEPFILVMALLIGAAVVGSANWRLRQIRKRQRDLEILVHERTKALVLEKQRTEEALREAESQRREAEEANKTKSFMLDVAAHDLKNPLVAVKNFAEIMKTDSTLSAESLERLDVIRSASQRMIRLLNDLLSESAIQTGKLPIVRRPIRLSNVAYAVIGNYRLLLEKYGQTATIHLPEEGEPHVLADPNLMHEAIDNLFSNAMKFSPPGSPLQVRIVNVKGAVRCEVRDRGPGLTDDDMKRLFQKFEKLSAKPTKGESSTGIGLSLVRQIIDKHNGSVWAENNPAGGSVFVLELKIEESFGSGLGFNYP